MQSREDFEINLAKQISDVFAGPPEIQDHRQEHPWLTGSLGDPYAGIWFLDGWPSLKRIQETTERGMTSGRVLTPNAQWGTTRGSQVLREALVKARFKDPEWNSSEGWHCYITNVIKEVVSVEEWTKEKETEATETWAPVLRWQLEQSSPKLVVFMGKTAEKWTLHLKRQDMISLPPVREICHYLYISDRAEGHRGPMHPERIREYQDAMLGIRREFDALYARKDAR